MENRFVTLLIFGKMSFSAQPAHSINTILLHIPLLGALALHARGPKNRVQE